MVVLPIVIELDDCRRMIIKLNIVMERFPDRDSTGAMLYSLLKSQLGQALETKTTCE